METNVENEIGIGKCFLDCMFVREIEQDLEIQQSNEEDILKKEIPIKRSKANDNVGEEKEI